MAEHQNKLARIQFWPFLLLALSVFASTARADINLIEFSYVPESELGAAYGVGLYEFNTREFGYYVNGSIGIWPNPYYFDLTPTTYNDTIDQSLNIPYIINVGATYVPYPKVGLYAGVGMLYGKGVAKLVRPSFGNYMDGDYYVSDPLTDLYQFNANIGALISAGVTTIGCGYQFSIKGGYCSIGIKLP